MPVPSMSLAFNNEIIHGSILRGREQELARVGVVEIDRLLRLGLCHELGLLFEIATVFGIVTVVIANVVGQFAITIPAQFGLDWSGGRAVCFWGLHVNQENG